MNFAIRATAPHSRARLATLVTPRAAIQTPVFMPVGTRATVRTQTLDQLTRIDAPILLANTYHLMQQPGIELFRRVGGLHEWMRWPHAILTDSGGYQIFSLGAAISDHGAELRLRGHRTVLTPERSIEMQRALGSDIIMVLDHCIASTCERGEAAAAMERTHQWAERSRAAAGPSDTLFAIVQGACFPDLRRASAAALVELAFPGYAIGGLAVGESRTEREDTTELVTERLPADRPRYLMGVGTPIDLLEGVHRGVDMFDCVLPTSLAQQGVAFTSHGRVDLRRGVYRDVADPLDGRCGCTACATYERSYLHHLMRCREPLGWQLLAHHNLTFYTRLMGDIRDHLAAGTFAAFYREQRGLLGDADREYPPNAPPIGRPKRPHRRGAYEIDTSAPHPRIRHLASGEHMHSINPPDHEAEQLYVGQSALLAKGAVVWDVGLGAAHNAMAMIRACEASGAALQLVSFERDLDALELALANLPLFRHLRHEAPHRLVREGSYRKGNIEWTLIHDQFLASCHRAPRPDVICYDPFSSAVDAPLWTLAAFRQLHELVSRAPRPLELFTYSASTAVRSAMLAAGFYVARGAPSGPKPETTIALLAPLAPHVLLGDDWLARRARSSRPLGDDVSDDDRPAVEAAIRSHPQFRPVSG